MKIFVYYFFTLVTFVSISTEFSYYLPIGFCHNSKLLCHYISHVESRIVIVESLQSILQLGDHPENFNSALPFTVSPVQPVLFFENNGFSYFDQGILKSKYFDFRSPGSIYTAIPFDHTKGIHWFNSQHGLVSILKDNMYVIYDLSLYDGSMLLVVDNSLQKAHSLFPFSFRETVFYVRDTPIKSEIIAQNETGIQTLFETNSKIILFCFFDESSGCFALKNSGKSTSFFSLIDFYFFNYSHETNKFDFSFLLSTKLSLLRLKSLLERGLFPWCLYPARLNGELCILGVDF